MKLFSTNALQCLYNFCFGGVCNICDFKLTGVNLWKFDILVSNIHACLKYAFLFVSIRSVQEGDPLKQVGFFIRCCKLKESAKSCKFLSSGSYWNLLIILLIESRLDKLFENAGLLWSGG